MMKSGWRPRQDHHPRTSAEQADRVRRPLECRAGKYARLRARDLRQARRRIGVPVGDRPLDVAKAHDESAYATQLIRQKCGRWLKLPANVQVKRHVTTARAPRLARRRTRKSQRDQEMVTPLSTAMM